MSHEEAAAVAALNQTMRELVAALRDLNQRLDDMGFQIETEEDA